MESEKDDLSRYRAEQDRFLADLEELQKDAELRQWLEVYEGRPGGKIKGCAKLYAAVVGYLRTFRGLTEAEARDGATVEMARLLQREPKDILKLLSWVKQPRSKRGRS